MKKINNMVQIKEQNRTPQLRFSEFSGEWREIKLCDFIDVIVDNRGKTPSITNDGIPLIEVNALGGRCVDYSQVKKFVSENTFKTWFRKYLQEKDVLFSTVGKTAVCSLYKEQTKSVIAQNIVGLRFSGLDQMFSYYLFIEKRNNHKFKRIEMGAVQPSLKVSQMINIKFDIPQKEEQKKIAEFLGLVDQWIENLEGQKAQWENYKKGMMQKLFPAKDQNVPVLRFKDENGNNFSTWEEKKLGSVCKKEASNISANSISENNGKYKIYGATGVLKKINFYVNKKPYISIVKDGAGVGRVFLCEKETSTLGTLDKIQSANTKVNLYFLLVLLKKIKFEKYKIGSTIPHIYFRDYKKEMIKIPSFPEQKKIADFLSAIDEVIMAKDQEITKAREWKKGLMQEMFV